MFWREHFESVEPDISGGSTLGYYLRHDLHDSLISLLDVIVTTRVFNVRESESFQACPGLFRSSADGTIDDDSRVFVIGDLANTLCDFRVRDVDRLFSVPSVPFFLGPYIDHNFLGIRS